MFKNIIICDTPNNRILTYYRRFDYSHHEDSYDCHNYQGCIEKTQCYVSMVRYQGPRFFNSLEDEIVNSISFQYFTIRLKSFLHES